MKIISGILVLISVYFSFRHGWPGVTNNLKPEQAQMVETLGLSRSAFFITSLLTLLVGPLVLIPYTFFCGNLLNAMLILLIMSLSLKAGDLRTALVEIPFLLMPLIMIYLGHPLRK